MRYRKFVEDAPRMLVLRSNYWLDGACLHAARGLGWSAAEAPVPQEGPLSREVLSGLFSTLIEFKPDFVLTVNMGGIDSLGLIPGLLCDLEVPCVVWFVDDPRIIIPAGSAFGTEWFAALTWDAAYIPFLRQQGFGLVRSMPLAVDASVFNCPPAVNAALPLAFVGNSMHGPAAADWGRFQEHPELAKALEEAFDGGKATRAAFAEGLEAVLGAALCGVMTPEQRCWAERLTFTEGTRRLRVEGALRLLEDGLQVFGDDGWLEYLPRERCGRFVNYAETLPAFYNACAVNLNITSIQMKHAVNQRVFDCPAAGGFLLTDAQSDLSSLFEVGVEMACYRDWDECAALIRHYGNHPDERRAMIVKARQRILAEHTYGHRLQAVAAWLKQSF